MKKIFSKKVLVIAIITWVLTVLAYLIGYISHSGGGFVDFGRAASGYLLSFFVFPFIIIGSIIYIIIKLKPNIMPSIIGYLILTVGVVLVAFLGIMTYKIYCI